MRYELVIVGGGIGGAVLATRLRRAGKQVLVVERDLAPPHVDRPEVHWPRTVQTLTELLPHVPAEELRIGIRALRVHYRNQVLAEIVANQQHPPAHSTIPSETRRRLLEGTEFELRRGVEAVAVLRDGPRVCGIRIRDRASGQEEEILADLTVGDDGPQSVIRQGCGIELQRHTVNLGILATSFAFPTTMPPASVGVWINEERTRTGLIACGILPQPGGRAIGMVAVRPHVFTDEPKLATAMQRFLASDATLPADWGSQPFPAGFTRFPLGWGHAAAYGIDGAVLMGDAAHPVTPAGGQGANMAVADGVALSEILTATNRPTDWLKTYEARRRPANRRSVGISRGLGFAAGLPNWLFLSLLPTLARTIAGSAFLRHRALNLVSTAFWDCEN